MTELTGFFAFSKYANMPDHKGAHEPVPTEWETVWLISHYNCYQNTVASDCFNQSFHSQAPRRPLKQRSASKAATTAEAPTEPTPTVATARRGSRPPAASKAAHQSPPL